MPVDRLEWKCTPTISSTRGYKNAFDSYGSNSKGPPHGLALLNELGRKVKQGKQNPARMKQKENNIFRDMSDFLWIAVFVTTKHVLVSPNVFLSRSMQLHASGKNNACGGC